MMERLKTYLQARNAGIIFYFNGPKDREILLVERSFGRGRGLWGGSGGKWNASDASLWKTAVRETLEEFGDHDVFRLARRPFMAGHQEPDGWEMSPFPYHFKFFFISVAAKPSLDEWPSRRAMNCNEWSRSQWFAVSCLPPIWKRLPGVGTAAARLPGQREGCSLRRLPWLE